MAEDCAMKDFSKDEWGLVLAGGGGKGAYQAGAFKALWEYGIQDYITAVSGASVGALNAVLFANKDIKAAGAAWESVSPGQFLAIEPSMIDGKEGLVSREGLLKMIDDYVNLEQVRTGDVTVYAAATEYDENGEGQGSIRYFELNNRPQDEIKDILLASSALPFIYTPVQIGDRKYRDGGLTDNLPIEPLYGKGIRHFIVIGLSMDRKIDYDRYPDAEFVYIKPSAAIGDFWNGTLDFTPRGAKVRMNLGYADAKRVLEYSDKDMSDEGVRGAYRITEQGDYDRIIFEYRKENIENQVNDDMDKINSLINRFM
jgi:NTE family protein